MKLENESETINMRDKMVQCKQFNFSFIDDLSSPFFKYKSC